MADLGAFSVDGVVLCARLDPPTEGFEVKSVPRPYQVSVEESPVDVFHGTLVLTEGEETVSTLSTMQLQAVEEEKTMKSIIAVCEWLEEQHASLASMLYVVGGGTIQDVGASAALLYKRGIPWTFVPTTLLSMADSCVGGKTGINHKGTKHLLGLFSPPRRVVIDPLYLDTLNPEAITSGLGEIFRTYITGGPAFLERFDPKPTADLILRSLGVKRAVVEYDEFELGIRKSMNYGHTIGHALEAATNFAVPHGIGVALGCLVENELAIELAGLSNFDAGKVAEKARMFLPANVFDYFDEGDRIMEFVSKDRKVSGTHVSLPLLAHIGETVFLDYPLTEDVTPAIKKARERFES